MQTRKLISALSYIWKGFLLILLAYAGIALTKDPALDHHCLAVKPVMVEMIESGVTADGGGHLVNASAVKSNDYRNAYMIAAELQAAGLDGNDIGLWLSNSLEVGEGMIFSVNPLATEFSVWPRKGSQFDQGAQEAINCVENK